MSLESDCIDAFHTMPHRQSLVTWHIHRFLLKAGREWMKMETPGSAFNTSLVNLHFTLEISKVPRSQELGGAIFLVISDHFIVRC